MAQLIFFASPTKLSVWRQCRLRYRFRYIQRIPTVPRPWLSFGVSIHAALRDIYDLPPERRTVERLEQFLEAGWDRRGYETPDEESSWHERAVSALRRYATEEEDFGVIPRPKLLEFAVQQKIGDVVLSGRVDRVDDTEAGLAVIDYKTGESRAPEQASSDAALSMYAALVAHRFKRAPALLEWRFVQTGEKITTARDPDALQRVRIQVLGEVAHIRAEEEFAASAGPWCRLCDYLQRCEEGGAAVQLRSGSD